MNRKSIKIIDFLIIIISIVSAFISYDLFSGSYYNYLIPTGFLIIAVIYGVKLFKRKPIDIKLSGLEEDYKLINSIALINEENNVIKEWDLIGKVSMVIGRDKKNNDIDIDLNDVTYSAMIDNQHAVLNFSKNNWYIEDLYSKNGVSIKKFDDRKKYKLSKDKPCKISKGDILYIANTKLVMK